MMIVDQYRLPKYFMKINMLYNILIMLYKIAMILVKKTNHKNLFYGYLGLIAEKLRDLIIEQGRSVLSGL